MVEVLTSTSDKDKGLL